MDDQNKLSIDTPEQVPIELPLAGVGSRFLALAIDTIIADVSLAILFVAFVLIPLSAHLRGLKLQVWLVAALILVGFFVLVGYFAVFEAVWNGQTPGKRLQHLRVIMDSGHPITTFAAATRNLLRVIDALPMLYGIGIISVLCNSQNKRLGDIVAGTVVVKEAPLRHELQTPADGKSNPFPALDVSQLTPDDFQLIDAFLMRSAELPTHVRLQMARRILERLAPKLQITAGNVRQPELLLKHTAQAFLNRTRTS